MITLPTDISTGYPDVGVLIWLVRNSQIPPHSVIPRNCLLVINVSTNRFGKLLS
jgi:hypothetical protein